MIDITLYSPQPTVLTFPVGLALGVLLGALIVNELAYMRRLNANKIKLYSRLKGEKYLLSQWFASVASGSIYIENNAALIDKIKESEFKDDKKFIKLNEGFQANDLILRCKYDDNLIELAKIEERFAKDLGLTEIYFADIQLRGLLIDAIERAKNAINEFDDNLSIEIQNGQYGANISSSQSGLPQINCTWQFKKLDELDKLLKNLDYTVDNLLIELKSGIEKKRWWQFWK